MNHDIRKGQAMLLAVFALGGAILGATTIAGLLTVYQIRATTDSEHSAAAIFAADTGVQWALFSYFCGGDGRCPAGAPAEPGTLGNGSLIVSAECFDQNNGHVACSDPTAQYAITKGSSLDSQRAFYVNLANATAAIP